MPLVVGEADEVLEVAPALAILHVLRIEEFVGVEVRLMGLRLRNQWIVVGLRHRVVRIVMIV